MNSDKIKTASVESFFSSPTDYGRSMIVSGGASHGNAPLFWVESRCRIIDPSAKVERDYYQCGSCKSEDTFGQKSLFLTPNFDFLPVFAIDHVVVFRRYASTEVGDKPYYSVSEPRWGEVRPKIRPAKARVLQDASEISVAVTAGLPLIGQVEISDVERGRTAILEFPIKTMNVSTDGKRWQVDTGPIVLPDLKLPPDQWAHALRLAFVAFKTDDWADFVIEVPTLVTAEDGGIVNVHHYSEILRLATRNRVLAIDID